MTQEELINYVSNPETFVVEQTPLIMQEILLEPWIGLLVSVCYSLTMIWGLRLGYKKLKISDLDHTIGYISISGLLLWMPLMSIGVNITDILQATLTPRIYILEYFTNLV